MNTQTTRSTLLISAFGFTYQLMRAQRILEGPVAKGFEARRQHWSRCVLLNGKRRCPGRGATSRNCG